MRAMTWISLLMLAAPALAGCIGFGAEDEPVRPTTKQRAAVTDATGGIEGVVTDNAIQPVVDVAVRLVEADLVTRTADDGSFAFGRLTPGAYTVVLNTTGFVPATAVVTVRAGQVAIADFVLVHLASDLPFTTALELTGFIECGVEVGWDLRPDLGPTLATVDETVNGTAGRDPNTRNAPTFFLGYAVCSAPNAAFANTTNDRFYHAFAMDPPLHTLLYAMVWSSTGTMSDWMTTRIEIEGFANSGTGTLFRVQGASPIEVRTDRERLDEIQTRFREQCDDGNDGFCGYSFYDDGWDLQTRVFPAWQCGSEKAGVCAPIQQSFTHYVTGYFNAPAPAGASNVPG